MNVQLPKISDTKNPESPDQMIGQTFGVYRVKKEIGRGGMGAVYLAERIDGVFRQEAAIKLVKRGMDTDSILRRFRNERQILANLNHPNIALLYGGGTTENGLPYFVMEYVAGEPLYSFCDSRKLKIKERLKIFVPICEAVHAAHQIKVVHRDLKPSNILVKADGTPKLLDFGIAKILDPGLAPDATVEQTATQMQLMTPEYASPEQVSSSSSSRGGKITTASDVYSLGVLLYELLSGHRPYRLKNRSPHEIARAICEAHPESLGESLEGRETLLEKGEARTLEKVLELRGSDLNELRRELSGELQQIVTNALRKKPSERYRSALELAEDIKLYLKGEAIKKPVSSSAKTKIFVEDRKPSLAVLPLAIIGKKTDEEKYLSVGLADALIVRLSNVRRIIVRPTSAVLRFAETGDALASARQLETNFVLSGTIRRAGTRVRISTQLFDVESETAIWSDRFNEELTDVLELEDKVAEKVGNLLIPHLTGDEQRKLSKRGTNNVQAFDAYLRARYHLFLLTPEGFAKAKHHFEEAIALDKDYALAYVGLAELYFALTTFGTTPPLEAYPKSRAMAQRALEIDDSLGEAYAILAVCHYENFDFAAMEKHLRRSVKLSPNHPLSRIWLANVLTFFGKSDEAIGEGTRAVELNPASTFEKRQLAWIYSHNRLHDEALKVSEATVSAEPDSAYCLTFYSRILRTRGRLRESLETAQRAVALPDGQIPLFVTNYAASLAAVGEAKKARAVLQKMENLPADIYVSPYNMAIAYANLGDAGRVFELLEMAYQTKDQRLMWIATDQQLDSLRGDARFVRILNLVRNTAAAAE